MALHVTTSGVDALGLDDWVITGCHGLPEISRVDREIEFDQSSEVGLMVAHKADELHDLDGVLWFSLAARRYAELVESGTEPRWQGFSALVGKYALPAIWSDFSIWLQQLYESESAAWTMPAHHAYFFRRVQSISQLGDSSIRRGIVQAWVVAVTNQGTVETPIGSQAADIDWTKLIAAIRDIL